MSATCPISVFLDGQAVEILVLLPVSSLSFYLVEQKLRLEMMRCHVSWGSVLSLKGFKQAVPQHQCCKQKIYKTSSDKTTQAYIFNPIQRLVQYSNRSPKPQYVIRRGSKYICKSSLSVTFIEGTVFILKGLFFSCQSQCFQFFGLFL